MYSKHHNEINVSVVKIVYIANSFSDNFHWSGLSFSPFQSIQFTTLSTENELEKNDKS